jgi:hypothetical protein
MRNFFRRENTPQLIMNAATLLVAAGMLFVTRALAAPDPAPAAPGMSPHVIAYQGTLVDSAENPVNGDQEMTFRIYNHVSDPGFLWEEAHTGANAVPVQNGLFNVLLGSLNPIPLSVWEETALFLGIQVGSDDEMTPRNPIAIAPLAHYAVIANSVTADSITGESVLNGSITQTDAPTLIQSANGNNEIIRSGNAVYTDSDGDGRILISYPCFPNGVRVFIAQNGHYNANALEVIGNNGTGTCSTTIIISPINTNPIRINWIAIGN